MLADLASTTEIDERRSDDSLVTDSDEEEGSQWPGLHFLQFQREKPKIPRRVKEKKMLVKAQNDILKFNRMGTHLANERTLLAWVRTAGSLFTLAIAFLKIESIQDLVLGSVLMVASLLTFIVGTSRYFTLKKGLEDTEIRAFHRLGIRHYLFMLAICFLAVVIERFYSCISAYIASLSQ